MREVIAQIGGKFLIAAALCFILLSCAQEKPENPNVSAGVKARLFAAI